jgi:hypothetical protein
MILVRNKVQAAASICEYYAYFRAADFGEARDGRRANATATSLGHARGTAKQEDAREPIWKRACELFVQLRLEPQVERMTSLPSRTCHRKE